MNRLPTVSMMVALLFASLGTPATQAAPALPPDPAIVEAASPDALTAFARRHLGGATRAANLNRGHINRNINVNRNIATTRNVKVNRTAVGVVGGVRGGVAVVRPVRPWVRRPYYGTVVAGVTLGTIIAASTIPTAPASDLCWYWSNSSKTRGYWDYCNL
jgi:hypothetical protein